MWKKNNSYRISYAVVLKGRGGGDLPSGDHLAMSEDIFGCAVGKEGCSLASSGVVARGTAKHPTVPVTATCNKESVLPRLRNPALEGED